MRAGRWLLTTVLTLLIPFMGNLGATSVCGHGIGHQAVMTSGTTSLMKAPDAGTTRDCGSGQPHTSTHDCTSMQACIVGTAMPEAPKVSTTPAAESSQAFPVAPRPHDRATLPHTPPPR